MTADYNQFNDLYQQHLGRDISQDEWKYLSKFANDEGLQNHEIGQIIQGTPEYQTNLLNKNTQQFGDTLNAQNGAILDQAAVAANSHFANLGRPVTSAQGASVMQAGGQLAQARQSALADFYGRGLNNIQGLSQSQGTNAMNRGYGLRDEARQRGYQIEDYYRQKNDYADAMNGGSLGKMNFGDFAQAGFGAAAKIGAQYLGGRATGAGMKAGFA